MNWMSKLNDDVKLNALSIPGTHDSVALRGGCWLKTQTFGIAEQLAIGIRFFDIRLKFKNGLFGYHKFIHQGISLEEILYIFNQYLSAFPSEIIMLCYRNENVVADECFNRAIQKVFRATRNCALFKTIPTLGKSRGTIMLIDRHDIGIGLNYQLFFKTCNLWNEEDITLKLSKLKKFIVDIPTTATYFHRTALNGSNFNIFDPFCIMGEHPEKRASITNKHMMSWFKKLNKQHIGVITMDFPPMELVSLIINFNNHLH
jgi:hypothetical protein